MNRHLRGEVQKGPELGSFCPCGVGALYPLDMRMCSLIWKLSEPHASGIFMEGSSYRNYR